MPKRAPIRRSSDSRWSHSCEPAGARRPWPRSSSPRARRWTQSLGAGGAAPSAPREQAVANRTGHLGKSHGLVRSRGRLGDRPVYEFVRAHQADSPVATMCRVLKVSGNGYYAWLRRPPSGRARADAVLRPRVEQIHQRSRDTSGAPRIQAELAEQGRGVSRKRVARLMLELGVRGVCQRRRLAMTRRRPHGRAVSDLVGREFSAPGSNQLWVADLTYIRTGEGFLYLSVVMDAWSRRVVGWAMATHLRTQLVFDALDMALGHRRPGSVIHHSDYGSQYTALAFGQRCREAGVRPSMGSVGDCYDNALCESFFATLETELLDRQRLATAAEAQRAVFDYPEGWYNPHRRHSALGYRSPVNFEHHPSPTEIPNAKLSAKPG